MWKKVSLVLAGLVLMLLGAVISLLISSSQKTAFETPSNSTVPLQSTAVLSETQTNEADGELVKVTNVVDGDTITIEGNKTIRYIGIDTPETVHPSKPVQCMGKEASDKNTELVEGKFVRLEKDVSETDRYGRLLRYVWMDDVLINELLVREGYAKSSSYPPDVKYQERFIAAEQLAREERKGLWSDVCGATSEVAPSTTTKNQPATSTSIQSQTTTNSGGENFTCDCKKSCTKMSSCAEAQYQLDACGCSDRDGDKDGIACDGQCQ